MENGFGSNVTRSENGDNVEYVINIEGQAKALVDANSQLANTAANYQQAEDFLARNIGIKSSPCLLYTSPSPRDKRQSRMPSSA